MIDSSNSVPFHVSTLASVQPLVNAFSGTCLDATISRSVGAASTDFQQSSALFTVGSAPRDVSAYSGLGATINAQTADGTTKLIDLCSMTENTVLGINDPWVKLKQVSYLLSSHPHYVTIRLGCDLYYRIANRILNCFEKISSSGDYVINLRECTGSGAVELALHAAWKAAAKSPGRRKLASFKGSFHGSNLGCVLASDHQPHRGSGRVLVERADNVELFPIPRVNETGELTEDALATLSTLERDGDQYFAVIIEPIPWRNSIHVVPTLFLERLREICTRKSICLIFDELQNGFGFTGTICFTEICGVCPDITVMGKGLTSGHGVLAIMVAKRAFKELESPFGFKSNSGNMLSLIAVDAVLDRLLGMDPEEAKALPAWLPPSLVSELQTGLLTTSYPRAVAMIDEMFAEFQRRFPSLVGASRGMGLVRGLVMLESDGQPSVRLAAAAAKVCLIHGVYVRQADTTVLIKPCMVLRQSEVDAALFGLSKTFEEVLRIRDER